MLFLFLICQIFLQVKTTTISREDLQEWKDEILEEIEPLKKKFELYGTSIQELKANVEGIDLNLGKLSSELNQTKSELNDDSELSDLSNKVNHLKFMSKMIKVIQATFVH